MCAAFLLAGFVHSIAGFGAGITAMAVLPLSLPLMDAVPVVAVFALILCLALTVQLRGSLRNAKVRSTLGCLAVGLSLIHI